MKVFKFGLIILLLLSFHSYADETSTTKIFTKDGKVQYWLLDK